MSDTHSVPGETQFILAEQDCIAGMKELPAESIDLVVTSPPYNLGIKYSKYEDEKEREEYLDWCVQWATEVKRVLKGDGSFFLNLGASARNPFLPHELILRLRALFVLQNTFHWIKSITVETVKGEQISAGHFKPIRSERFVNDCHEFVFHLTRTGSTQLDRRGLGVPYMDKSNIGRWGHTKGRDLRCRGNTWFVPYKTILSRTKERPHPATFPVQLAVNCIKIHGHASRLHMLDPFVGIGHSAMAAKECKVKQFIGFDIDREYLQIARNLVEKGAVQPVTNKLARAPRGRKRTSTSGQAMLFEDRA